MKPHYPTPTDARLTSPFGWRTNPVTGARNTHHDGIDLAPRIAGTTGVPIFAVCDGVVEQSLFNSISGNRIYIRHNHDNYYSVYGHLASRLVKVGDRVRRGQQIGVMGTTGQSTGIHLHFGISPKFPVWSSGGKLGNFIKPQNYLNKSYGGKIKVDGKWGKATETLWQQIDGMKVVDGVISNQWKSKANENIYCAQFNKTKRGSNHVRHLQRQLKVNADGLFGPATIRAAQREKGTPADGMISPVSTLVKAIQRDLNAGRSPFK